MTKIEIKISESSLVPVCSIKNQYFDKNCKNTQYMKDTKK